MSISIKSPNEEREGNLTIPEGPLASAEKLTLIESHDALEAACQRWRRSAQLGIDTEFVRERTFYPYLGLIQVADDESAYLVDTVTIDDLGPLADILQDSQVTKIFHSCGEDLEVLYHRFGAFPQPVFDTQVAAAMCGLGYSIGYGRLVESLFDVQLPKDKTRTNWMRRPLSDAQKLYAAQDVVYLIPAFRRLQVELRRLGREEWIQEELQTLFDIERFLPAPDLAYQRIKSMKTLQPRQLAVLQKLAEWREQQARKRNLPRNFVLHEKTLVELARKQPTGRTAIGKVESLRRLDRERYGETLTRLVQEGRQATAEDLPSSPRQGRDLATHRQQIQQLRQDTEAIAKQASLPPELLVTRKGLEKLMRRFLDKRSPVLPRELRGWRQSVVGEQLLERLNAGER